MKKLLMILLASTLIGGCVRNDPPSKKNEQAKIAEKAANNIKFTANAEIENITKRLQITSDPGLMGYVVLLSESGQPVLYTTVKGKITSGSKRLTKPYEYDSISGSYSLVDAPSDEGTYGSSNPYIFFWSQSGQYVQWSGHYLYSDKPIRLSIKPLVIDVAE